MNRRRIDLSEIARTAAGIVFLWGLLGFVIFGYHVLEQLLLAA